jgi:hypothetical protein
MGLEQRVDTFARSAEEMMNNTDIPSFHPDPFRSPKNDGK